MADLKHLFEPRKVPKMAHATKVATWSNTTRKDEFPVGGVADDLADI